MRLEEAIAVYLTLMNKSARTPQEEEAFHSAWGKILQEGERITAFYNRWADV